MYIQGHKRGVLASIYSSDMRVNMHGNLYFFANDVFMDEKREVGRTEREV